MPTRKSIPRDLSDEEYRHECMLRNTIFIDEKEAFLDRWKSEPDLFIEPIEAARNAQGLNQLEAYKEHQRKRERCIAEAMALREKWPSVSLGDIIGGVTREPAPKVQVVFAPNVRWPHDGSLFLRVDPTATGDEIKQQWQNIKKRLGLTSRRQGKGDRRLKLRIYDLYRSLSQSKDKRLANFADIARIFKKARSTIIHLYDSVYRDIHGIKPKSVRWLGPNFDMGAHFATCPSCQRGNTCPLAEDGLKAYLRQLRT